MRILLDTHVMLWALAGDTRLGKAKPLILDPANEIAVSTASYLELAIKASQGKIDIDLSQIRAAVAASGYGELPVTGAHAEALAALPWHHKDPFDRILVAQALAEPMRLLTADSAVARYSDTVMLV
jgi:PIN domain nuclease of toxin-antitoxin system